MNEKLSFKSIRIPEPLMEEMRTLKHAYEECYGRKLTYEDALREMMGSVKHSDPAVYEMFQTIRTSRKEMQEKINALKNS